MGRAENLVDDFISFSTNSEDPTPKWEIQYNSQKNIVPKSFFSCGIGSEWNWFYCRGLSVLTWLSAASLALFSLTNPTPTVSKYSMTFSWVEKRKMTISLLNKRAETYEGTVLNLKKKNILNATWYSDNIKCYKVHASEGRIVRNTVDWLTCLVSFQNILQIPISSLFLFGSAI